MSLQIDKNPLNELTRILYFLWIEETADILEFPDNGGMGNKQLDCLLSTSRIVLWAPPPALAMYWLTSMWCDSDS